MGCIVPKDIFGDVVRPSVRLGSRAWYTVPLSIAVHAAIVTVLVVVPLMAADALPAPSTVLEIVVTSPPPPAPPPPAAVRPATQPTTRTETNERIVITQPSAGIVPEAAPPPIPGTPGGTAEGVSNGIPGSTAPITVVPPPPPPAVRTEPVRPGGHVKRPAKIKDVRPTYPQIALTNRVEGLVMIEAIIGTDGSVKEARVIKSVPLLDHAAVDAVMQWKFTPTLLNGVPVPVIMTVTVNFTLQ